MKIMDEGLPYEITHYHKALAHFSPFLYGQNITHGNTTMRMIDAGHIAGSAMVEYEYQDRTFVYTGDFNCTESQMHKPAKYVKDVDYLMIESTYAKKDHPERKKTEHAFMDEVEMTIEEGGNVLLPSFALGRAQELISIIRHYNREVPVWLDGMGRDISQVYLKYGKYIKDAEKFRRVLSSVKIIKSMEDRKRAIREPSVIVSTAGMMNGGPIINYLLNANAKSKVIFTGFCVEGTNGWLLQNKGTIMKDDQELKVDLPVLYFDFSAHAGRSDILNMIKHANPQKIMLVHGDKPEEFAKELFGWDV
jgi:putative mRNA 3-end processing factor